METLAHLGFHLSGLLAVMQASGFECLVFNPFPFLTRCLDCARSKHRQVSDWRCFHGSEMVVVADEVSDLLFEITGQIIVLEQDAVFECLVPALDFALGLRVHERTTGVIHALCGMLPHMI